MTHFKMTPEQFRQIRKSLGLNPQKMAEFLGLKDRRTIQRYESGARPIPGTVIKILELSNIGEKKK